MLWLQYFLALFVVHNACVATPLSPNAELIALGFAPRSPLSFGRFFPGSAPKPDLKAREVRGVREVSRYRDTRWTTVTYTGRIQVYTSTGQLLGNVSSDLTGINNGTSSSNAASIQFNFTLGDNTPFNIRLKQNQQPHHHHDHHHHSNGSYLGLNGGTTSIGPNSTNTINFSTGNATTLDSAPVNGFESQVWSFNTTNSELTAQYTNPNGSQPSTFISYSVANNKFAVSGNPNLLATSDSNAGFQSVSLNLASA